jgi:hypothetical protein
MAAGEGFKEWQTGDVLTANDVNGYLNQGIWVFDDAADRTAQVTSPEEGNFAYLRDDNKLYYYTGSAWAEADTSGIQPSEFAAKGDLLAGTGSATFDNLAVGANGTVLTADSAETTGLKWVAPAGVSFVGCSAIKITTAQSIANNTETAISFNDEEFDTDSFHDNSTNNTRFTIPSGKNGKYLIVFQTQFASNATGFRQMYLKLNGNALSNGITTTAVNGTNHQLFFSGIFNLVATDYVEGFVFQNSGGSLNVNVGAANTKFVITYLGA